MSWIVQNLWINKSRIKSKSNTYVKEYQDDETVRALEDSVGYDDPFIENDEFNDLLVIEKAVNELVDLNLLTPHDLEVLDRESGGLYNRRNRQRKTHSKEFSAICNRIAYFLGGYFTDDGYIDYLARKHKLNEQHIEILRSYIKSKYKNKILNKGYRLENTHEEARFISAEM